MKVNASLFNVDLNYVFHKRLGISLRALRLIVVK